MKYLRFLLALVLATAALGAAAQGRQGRPDRAGGDRIKEARRQFLTERLMLEGKQAEQFWAVHERFDAEMQAVHQKMKALKNGFQVKADDQLEADLDQFFKLKEQGLAIEKKYHAEFKKVLSMRQLAVFYQSEQQFKRWLLEQWRQRGGGAQGGPPPFEDD
jgi:hypothetical protein